MAASDLNNAADRTAGNVNAATVVTVTGEASVDTLYNQPNVLALGNENITLSDTSLAATVISTVAGHTTETVNASSVLTITGAAADVNTAYARIMSQTSEMRMSR